MRGNFDYNCFTPGMTDQGCKSELSVYSFDRLFVTAKVLGSFQYSNVEKRMEFHEYLKLDS